MGYSTDFKLFLGPEWGLLIVLKDVGELTVNQPSYDFEGSSPSSPTILISLKN